MSSYQDYLIADFKEGKRQDRESWLLPNEAFSNLENVFMRRGIIHKRYGYRVYGQMGTLESGTSMTKDGATERYTVTIGASYRPIIAHSFIATTNNSKVAYDDGNGNIVGDVDSGGTNTIDYSTGAVDLTFSGAASATCTCDHHYSDTGTDRNVRGIFNIENTAGADACVVCDRDNAALFDTTYKYFKNIPLRTFGTYSYFGNKSALVWGTSYKQKLFLCDGIGTASSGIWVYNPSLGSDGEIYQKKYRIAAGNAVAGAAAGTGDGSTVTFTQASAGAAAMVPPVVEGTFTLTDGVETFTDNSDNTLTGDAGGTGTINYITGDYSVTFNTAPAGPVPGPAATLTKGYTTNTTTMDYATIIIPYYQRLVALKTKETANSGSTYTTYRQRARWCKINDPTKWRADIGGEGSSIDAATNEVILSAALIRGTLVVAFEKSIWALDYTGNKSIPFRWRKLAGNIEINTVFGRIVTEDLVVFVGHGGIYGCDGMKVERIDGKIPDFTDEDINLDYVDNCYGGYDKKLDQALLCYTSLDSDSVINDRTLVFSVDEGWFSKYTWGMNCLNNYVSYNPTTWTTLYTEGTTWGAGNRLGKTWKEIYQQSKEDVVLGGSSKGYIYAVNDTARSTDEVEGTETSYNFNITSKRFTPYIQEGQKVTLGYIDILVGKTDAAAATLQLHSGEDSGIYLIKPFDMQSTKPDSKIWKRMNVCHDANNHSFTIKLDDGQMADDDIAQSSFRIHAFNLGMRPSGRVRLS